MVIKKEINNL